MSEKEEMRPVPDLPDHWADTDGVIWEPTGDGGMRPATLCRPKGGYPFVNVRKADGKRGPRDVHRLVCAAFHGPAPHKGAHARHLNHDKADSRPKNLAWGSRADNAADSKRAGRYRKGQSHPHAKLSDHDVHALRVAHSLKVPASALAERWNISVSHVHALVSGRRRPVGGGEGGAELTG